MSKRDDGRARSHHPDGAGPEAARGRRRRRVVVLAAADARDDVARHLEAGGYTTLDAKDLAAALEHGEREHVDAFIVDLNAPAVDGLGVIAGLRASECHARTPVLGLKRAGDVRHIAAAFAAGADDLVSRPVHPEVLNARLASQLERHHSLAEVVRLGADLDRYVSRRTRRMLHEHRATGVLPQPRNVEACVLVVEMRAFARPGAPHEPDTMFAALADALAVMIECVNRHGGHVDRLAGDGIMATFEHGNAARAGAGAALELLARTRAMTPNDATHGVELRLGLHHGTALVGNVGSTRHPHFTVVGTTVELAARLGASAAPMSIVASDAVVAACGEAPGLRFTAPCEVHLRGIARTVTVYQLNQAPGA
ncbi:MAG: adenylate/guanylate cyclase domain-containing protein [Gammaproteobacteria bacterium]